jgi:hypothetical protein
MIPSERFAGQKDYEVCLSLAKRIQEAGLLSVIELRIVEQSLALMTNPVVRSITLSTDLT